MIIIFNIMFLIILLIIVFLLQRIIKKNGLNIFAIFIAIYTLFYIITPTVFINFKKGRDTTTLFTRLLNNMSVEEILLNVLLLFLLLLLIVLGYMFSFTRKTYIPTKDTFIILNKKYYFIFQFFTNVLFICTFVSMIMLILKLGGVKNYLAFGAFTRGLYTSPEQFIGSNYLQLITFSTLILALPFLYYYVYKIKNSKIYFLLFLFSILLSVLFLIHNQGRAPLILFFLPFLYIIRSKKKKPSIIPLAIIFFISIALLNAINDFFNILTYGQKLQRDNESLIAIFTKEFSYPFSNFALKDQLIDLVNFRYYFDFIIWPFTMIPDGILNILGITKSGLRSVSLKSTDAYSQITGEIATGGIPVDVMTLNYFQMGYFSLLINTILLGVLIKFLDSILVFFKNNIAITLIKYRIAFSIINMINNADPSAIIRNRLDVFLLIIFLSVLYFIYKKQVFNYETNT